MDALPPELEAEREALLREIDEAFDFTVRGAGISWTEAAVLDSPCATVDERQAGREMDRDCDWREFVNDPPWDEERSLDNFCFLDAIGFRYYLAPVMIRGLRGAYVWELSIYLTPHPIRSPYFSENPEQWSALSAQQKSLVARFIQLMDEDGNQADKRESGPWSPALSYWRRFL